MDATWMQSLNEQQRAAATFGLSPLLIIAGAGTGKTNTLAHRVAHLIAEGTDPSRILLLTFTRRASAEMLKRVENILCSRGANQKALLARVWGYDYDPGSNVVDVYVGYLRRKLGTPKFETVRGVGYRFKA